MPQIDAEGVPMTNEVCNQCVAKNLTPMKLGCAGVFLAIVVLGLVIRLGLWVALN